MNEITIINNRIHEEICYKTIDFLTDTNLLEKYKKCPSVNVRVEKLKDILGSENIPKDTQNRIINKYILEIIPAGTKGIIRGNEFNKIIKNHILSFKLSLDFQIKFEQDHEKFKTTEKPDWDTNC